MPSLRAAHNDFGSAWPAMPRKGHVRPGREAHGPEGEEGGVAHLLHHLPAVGLLFVLIDMRWTCTAQQYRIILEFAVSWDLALGIRLKTRKAC